MSRNIRELFVVTEKDVSARNHINKRYCRCRLCGHKAKVGERVRMVYANFEGSPSGLGNFFVCESCNQPDEVLLSLSAERENARKKDDWWANR